MSSRPGRSFLPRRPRGVGGRVSGVLRGRWLILLVVLVAASCATVAAERPAPAADPSPEASPDVGEQRQDEAGSVTITVSWITGSSSALVGMNTHSVDLDVFDLALLARVRLDGGAWTAPTAWDAPRGGHHRAGTLTFGTLDPQALANARVVELEILDVRVPSRMLRWER